MTQPLFFQIVIISKYGQVSSTVTSFMRWEDGISPSVVAAHIYYDNNREEDRQLVKAGLEYGLVIPGSINLRLLDPKTVSLWLALDNPSENSARERIQKEGPRPKNFYQDIFPDPVVNCGFEVPTLSNETGYESWFRTLENLFKPWKERIWEAFCSTD